MPVVLVAEDEFLIRALLIDALANDSTAWKRRPARRRSISSPAASGSTRSSSISAFPICRERKSIEAALGRRPGVPIVRCSGMVGDTQPPSRGFMSSPKPYSAIQLSNFVASLVSDTRQS